MKLFIDEITGTEFAIIEHEDNSTTSMTKAVYDEQQANAEKGTIS